MHAQALLSRVRNGVVDPKRMRACDAVVTHKKGDRYTDGVYEYRLHRQISVHAPEPHYEFEPRWYKGVHKGGVIPGFR